MKSSKQTSTSRRSTFDLATTNERMTIQQRARRRRRRRTSIGHRRAAQKLKHLTTLKLVATDRECFFHRVRGMVAKSMGRTTPSQRPIMIKGYGEKKNNRRRRKNLDMDVFAVTARRRRRRRRRRAVRGAITKAGFTRCVRRRDESAMRRYRDANGTTMMMMMMMTAKKVDNETTRMGALRRSRARRRRRRRRRIVGAMRAVWS
jgi:hypothetical protein